MLYDIPAFLKSISDLGNKVFDFKKTAKEHQAETEIMKDDERKVKALRYADEALELIENSNGYLNEFDLHKFKKLKQKFDNLKIN